jgi:hypothetical protein
MPDKKQKSDDSDDEGDDLPDVGIQAPYVAQKGKQSSACDHKNEMDYLLRRPKMEGPAAPEKILSDQLYKIASSMTF